MEKRKKIATITLNPSVDITYTFDDFRVGYVNRTDTPIQTAGGKGLNVSRVIRLLGEEVVATGFLGGLNGQFIREQLDFLAIDDKFISINEETRRCYAFINRIGNNHTEVLEHGPFISVEYQKKLKDTFIPIIREVDVAVVSGSLPKGLGSELYQFFVTEANRNHVKLLLDTSGHTLEDCLKSRPYMIKPNRQEVEQIFNKKLKSEQEIWDAIHFLADNGIPLVILTDGENGSYVMYEGETYKVPTRKIKAINPVGSGDAFVAGIAVGLQRDCSIEQTLSLATACGAANAMEARTGYVSLKNVSAFMHES